jgi:diacylglycerol diphosphate phosphatase/phosphatidate phosphatase
VRVVTDIVLASFGGLFYLSLYISAKLHVLDSRGEVWKLFVAMAPTLGAALVAGSRIMDARHHPFDVITGSLIGVIFAYAAYRQYFPAISDCHAKGRAYPMVGLCSCS